ncbi:MAG TPA: hypothetical protein VGG63_08865, partial [Steroidobacteraceae bacterium]
IEVITIYCRSGTVDGQTISEFCVSSVTSVGPAVSNQLGRWPFFRLSYRPKLTPNLHPECRETDAQWRWLEENVNEINGRGDRV